METYTDGAARILRLLAKWKAEINGKINELTKSGVTNLHSHILDHDGSAQDTIIAVKADLVAGKVPMAQISEVVVISDSPSEGYKEVTKLWVHLATGLLLVEHKL